MSSRRGRESASLISARPCRFVSVLTAFFADQIVATICTLSLGGSGRISSVSYTAVTSPYAGATTVTSTTKHVPQCLITSPKFWPSKTFCRNGDPFHYEGCVGHLCGGFTRHLLRQAAASRLIPDRPPEAVT